MLKSDPKVKVQAKKYKKFFEKAALFYPYKKESQTYIMIRYSRFNNVTGDLIVTAKGDVLPRAEAATIFQDYTKYDSCMLDCVTLVARSKDLPVKSPQKIQQLLKDIVIPTLTANEQAEMMEDIQKVLTAM